MKEYSLKELAQIIIVNSMQEQIDKLGHLKIWQCIERMSNAKQRARYRKFFLKAGGHIIKSNIKED